MQLFILIACIATAIAVRAIMVDNRKKLPLILSVLTAIIITSIFPIFCYDGKKEIIVKITQCENLRNKQIQLIVNGNQSILKTIGDTCFAKKIPVTLDSGKVSVIINDCIPPKNRVIRSYNLKKGKKEINIIGNKEFDCSKIDTAQIPNATHPKSHLSRPRYNLKLSFTPRPKEWNREIIFFVDRERSDSFPIGDHNFLRTIPVFAKKGYFAFQIDTFRSGRIFYDSLSDSIDINSFLP